MLVPQVYNHQVWCGWAGIEVGATGVQPLVVPQVYNHLYNIHFMVN